MTVSCFFLEEQSYPDDNHFSWTYNIRIENFGTERVRVLSRHWCIHDACGHIQEVQGYGLIGEQPLLLPGDCFEYTSGVSLAAPSGVMIGTYLAVTGAGESFDIEIPPFSLDSPHQDVVYN